MAKFALGVDPSYAFQWSVEDAVREFLQNALDRKDEGAEMKVSYDNRTRKMRIITTGKPLTRADLLIGHTDKRDDPDKRGQQGEGIDVGMLVLLRHGIKVWIRSGAERWIPAIEHTKEFGAESLTISTAKVKYFDGVEVQIRGLDPDCWTTVKHRTLYFDKNLTTDKVPYSSKGRVLQDPKYQNQLYVGGLFVTKLAHDYTTGFDFLPSQIELGRDRNLVDPWNLHYAIRSLIKLQFKTGDVDTDTAYRMLEAPSGESQAFENDYVWNKNDMAFHEEMAEKFEAKYGEKAIPVSSLGEAQAVGHIGMVGIQVPAGLKKVVEIARGPLEERRQKLSLQPKRVIQANELEDHELLRMRIATQLVAGVDPSCSLDKMQVVEFADPDVKGTFQGEFIRLSRGLLGDFDELMATLIHEIAHNFGDDGDASHRARGEYLASVIIGKMARQLYPQAFPEEVITGE